MEDQEGSGKKTGKDRVSSSSDLATNEIRTPYRMIGYCLLVGVFGAVAALLFDVLVDLAQPLLLHGIGGYVPPRAGVLDPVAEIPPLGGRLWFPIVTTLGGLLSGIIVYSLAPEAEGHGTDGAIRSYHQGVAKVRDRVPPIKAITSAIIIGSGGVAGREGPTAQISVGLGAMVSRWLGLRGAERRILLLCAMSAGLSAVFRAPLGMAIFSVEILYAGMAFEAEALIYTVISAVTAYAFHGFFVGWSPIFLIPKGLVFHQPETLVGYAVLGLAAGIFGTALPTVFYGIRDLFLRIPGPPHFKPALGGLLVGCLGIFFPQILGTGYGWVELALAGKLSLGVLLLVLLLKAPAMGLSVGSGGSGGIFGPTVVMGAMLGGVIGTALHALVPSTEFSIASFVVVGMAAVFSGAARTPISTLIMVAEMTGGYGLIVPAMLANVLAFVVQRSLSSRLKYPTLYQSQVTSREDSPAHRGLFLRRALQMIEGGEVDQEVTLPRLVSFLRLGQPIPIGHGAEMLVSVIIGEDSTLHAKTVAEALGGQAGVTAVAVMRGQDMLVPRGPTMLRSGDQLLAVVTPSAYSRLQALARSFDDGPDMHDSDAI